MLSEKQQIWGIWLSAKNLTQSKSMGILDYIKCRYSKTAYWKKIETWHVGLSCQYGTFYVILSLFVEFVALFLSSIENRLQRNLLIFIIM